MINNKKQGNRLIYSLNCPFTDEVHYIGKTTQGLLRPLSHMNNSHSEKVKEWANELKEIGQFPIVKVLEYCEPDEDISEREKYWIHFYWTKGSFLLNDKSVPVALINTKLDNIKNMEIHVTDRIRTFIKAKRKLLNLTQPELASKAGVGLRFIRELEQGNKTSLNIGKVQDVLNLFGCMLDVIKIPAEFKD